MNLEEYFIASKSNKKIWIDMIPYANQIFAKGGDEIWSNPTTFISVYSQGQGLLKSDILSVPVINVYQDFIKREAGITEQWNGKGLTFVLREILALDEPKRFLIDVITGLQNLYLGAYPLVLVLPSSQNWLQWIQECFRPEENISLDEDDIEFASMYVAEYLQSFSSLNLSGVVMKEREPTLALSKALPLYQPILNVIKHFQWMVGMNTGISSADIEEIKKELDFVLFDNSSLSEVLFYWQKGDQVGGGLNDSFWTNSTKNDDSSLIGLAYGEIPKDANPEKVLTQLKWLRN